MRLYLCLLITKVLVAADVFTLIKEKNIKCVLTNDSVYSALYISSTNQKFPEKNVRRSLSELTNWITDDWSRGSTEEYVFYPVTDIRWEDFKEIDDGKIKLNENFTSFSACFGGVLKMTASDDDYNMEMIHLSQGRKDESGNMCRWSHYVIFNDRILQAVDENKSKVTEEVWETVFFPKQLNFQKNNVHLKVHQYNFRFSNLTTLKDGISYLDISTITNSTNICIAMFVSLDVDSYLDIILETGTSSVSQRIEGFNKKNDFRIWKKIEIRSDFYDGTGKLHFYRTRRDDERNGFWAIDKIHLCRPEIDVYDKILNDENSQICKSLGESPSEKIFCDRTGYLGEKCEINCEKILGKSYSFCQEHKICREDGTCGCAWGYQGEGCTKTCDANYWGLNCSLKYNSGKCEKYNGIFGCTTCKDSYFGNQCLEKLPVVTKPPILTSIKENSIEIFLGNLTYGSVDEARPEFYQIQYKKNDAAQYTNNSDLIPYTGKFSNNEFTIKNVSPKKFEYQIRIILIVQNHFFEKVPKLITPATSSNSTTRIIQVELPTNIYLSLDEIVLNFENSNEFYEPVTYFLSYKCLSEWCLKESTKRINLELTEVEKEVRKEVKDFSPFSVYEVEVAVLRSEEKLKRIFTRTSPPSKPHSVQNLSSYSNTDDTVYIRWKDPYPPTGTIEFYNITYEDLTQQVFSSTFLIPCIIWTNFTCAILTGLKKETLYNLRVRVKNVDVFEWSEPTELILSTELRKSEAPLNLRVKLSREPNQIILIWEHPSYTYGPLEKFRIEVNDGEIETYWMVLDKLQEKYEYRISVEHNKDYIISISGANQFLGKESTVNVVTLLPVLNSISPIVQWCSKNCFLLVPKREDLDLNIMVLKKIKDLTEEEIKKIYKSLTNGSSQNNDQWIVESKNNYPDFSEIEIGEAPPKAVSVHNPIYTMYFIQRGDLNMTAYSIGAVKIESASNRSTAYALIVVFCTIAIIALLGYFYRKLRKNRRSEEKLEDMLLLTSIETDSPSTITSFENYLKDNLLENNFLLIEFQSLPNEKIKTCEAALRENNLNKNRSQNFVPYDSARVVLEDFEGYLSAGDYINASYIDGYNRPRAYIACQGPKFSTVIDFWRMIWQEKVEVIVMATDFVNDDGSRNCAEYWSPGANTTCEYGKLTIKTISENFCQNYDKQEFEVQYLDKVRKIRHYHLKWSLKKDIIFYPNDVLPVMKHLREVSENGTFPVVVHSGSGTDRNGVLILCDMALQMIKDDSNVNVCDLLRQMREQRPHMVNSLDYYVLAHLTVLEFLTEQQSPFKKSVDEFRNLDLLQEQLDYLEKLYWHDAIIDSLNLEQKEQKKIELISVDGYRNKKQFLLCQQPTKSVLYDFWIAVRNEDVKYILYLNKLKHPLWPYRFNVDEETVEISQMCEVDVRSCYTATHLWLATYDKSQDKVISEQDIWFFHLKDWDPKPEISVNIVENVRRVVTDNQKPTLIICQDDFFAGGLFTVLYYAMEKYEKELEIDLCYPLRTLRRSKSQLVLNCNHLKVTYAAILEFFENFDRYKHIYSKN